MTSRYSRLFRVAVSPQEDGDVYDAEFLSKFKTRWCSDPFHRALARKNSRSEKRQLLVDSFKQRAIKTGMFPPFETEPAAGNIKALLQ